jgi:capsular exopolysaccharide synthesis family protein
MNHIRRLRGLEVIVYSPTEIAIREVQEARMVFDVGKDGAVTITATAFSPRVAVDLANSYVEVLLAKTSSFAREQNRGTRELLENLLGQTRATQTEAEQALAKFQAEVPGVVKLPDEVKLDATRLAQLETTLADIHVSREIAQKRLAYLKGPEKEAEKPAAPGPVDPAVQAARDRLNKLEAKLAAISSRVTEVSGSGAFAESHPQVQAARAEVQDAQDRLRSLVTPHQSPRPGGTAVLRPAESAQLSKQMADLEVEIVSLQAREQGLQQRIAQLKRSMGAMGAREQEYSALTRGLETQRQQAAMLAEKLTAARMNEQSQIRGIQVVDLAALPRQPSSKGPLKKILLGLAAGLGLGLALATALEYAHRVIETEEEVIGVTGFPALGAIPVVTTLGNRKRDRPLDFLGGSPMLPMHADACRMIRFALESQALEQPLRTILVTSPGVHEGKTTVTLNLGRAFYEAHRRVLLVDADLRRPALHHGLEVPNEIGLADLLCGTGLEAEAFHTLSPGLEVMPSGTMPANPSALLSSKTTPRALELARGRADIVFIDSPPLLAVSDALPLTGLVDGVVLVVRSGVTERRALERAKEQLDRVGARVLGIVLNGLSSRDARYYYAGYKEYEQRAPRKRRSRVGDG